MEDLDDLYENAPCGYLSLTGAGVIVKANQTLANWLELDVSALIGKQFHDLLNVPGKIFYETHFAPLLRMQGYFNEVALDLINREGRYLPVLANAAERRSPDGAVQFTRITLFKAVDRRRYERDLVNAKNAADRARSDLEALNRTLEQRIAEGVAERLALEQGLLAEQEVARLRDQFVAILGHDLRSPLASVSAGLTLLGREGGSEKAKLILELMGQSVKRMSDLVSDMLDLARSQSGRGLPLEPRPTDLRAVIGQVVGEFRTAHPEREIQSDVEIRGQIVCDGARISQVISNLIGNALTHGAAGRPVRVSAVEQPDGYEISVVNEGQPIPDHIRSHLFQPFFRASSAANQGGLGLGLFISSEIARSHGGTLTVFSDHSHTAFVFQMPRDGIDTSSTADEPS